MKPTLRQRVGLAPVHLDEQSVERLLAARVAAILIVVQVTLLAVTSGGWSLPPDLVVPAAIGAGLAIGLLILCRYEHQTMLVRNLLALVLVVVVAVLAVTQPNGQRFLAAYDWLVLYAAFFYPPRWAAFQLGVVVAVSASLLVTGRGADSVAVWLTETATIAGVGLATILLRRRISGLMETLVGKETQLEELLAFEQSARVEVEWEKSQLAVLAETDPLTGLLNRRALEAHLGAAIEEAREEGFGVVVVSIDVDGLKPVNDVLGHAAGDHLISEVACRLNKASRRDDVVARVGGDEFVVVAPHLDPAVVGNVSTAITTRIDNQLATQTRFRGRDIPLSASVGAACFPEDATDAEALLAVADDRMYCAKRARRAERAA